MRKEKNDIDLNFLKEDLKQEIKNNSLRTIIEITLEEKDLEKYDVEYHKRYLTLARKI